MMVALYVTSIERYVGKDLITMGLMDRMRRDGFKVGYFKPIGHCPLKVDNTVTDKGAQLVHSLKPSRLIRSINPIVIRSLPTYLSMEVTYRATIMAPFPQNRMMPCFRTYLKFRVIFFSTAPTVVSPVMLPKLT